MLILHPEHVYYKIRRPEKPEAIVEYLLKMHFYAFVNTNKELVSASYQDPRNKQK